MTKKKNKRKRRKRGSLWAHVDKGVRKRFKKGYDPWEAAGYQRGGPQ